jgi:uncharacterized protein (TIGR03085 family)
MEPMSRTERAALCNSALEAGEEAPTLCGRWTVKDLVIHLLVRERDPLGAPGILVPQLEGLTERASRRLADQDFTSLVERVRQGPPKWSPMALPPLDRAVNTLEYFIHHEDIRRATAGWEPRELTPREQKAIWKSIAVAGRGLVRKVDAGVEIRWPDGAEDGDRSAVLRKGERSAVVAGQPAELALFLYGRSEHTGLDLSGDTTALDTLRTTSLGL